jgi:hypothetical protein
VTDEPEDWWEGVSPQEARWWRERLAGDEKTGAEVGDCDAGRRLLREDAPSWSTPCPEPATEIIILTDMPVTRLRLCGQHMEELSGQVPIGTLNVEAN